MPGAKDRPDVSLGNCGGEGEDPLGDEVLSQEDFGAVTEPGDERHLSRRSARALVRRAGPNRLPRQTVESAGFSDFEVGFGAFEPAQKLGRGVWPG